MNTWHHKNPQVIPTSHGYISTAVSVASGTWYQQHLYLWWIFGKPSTNWAWDVLHCVNMHTIGSTKLHPLIVKYSVPMWVSSGSGADSSDCTMASEVMSFLNVLSCCYRKPWESTWNITLGYMRVHLECESALGACECTRMHDNSVGCLECIWIMRVH